MPAKKKPKYSAEVYLAKRADFTNKCKRIQDILDSLIEPSHRGNIFNDDGILVHGKQHANTIRCSSSYGSATPSPSKTFLKKRDGQAMRSPKKIAMPLNVWNNSLCYSELEVNSRPGSSGNFTRRRTIIRACKVVARRSTSVLAGGNAGLVNEIIAQKNVQTANREEGGGSPTEFNAMLKIQNLDTKTGKKINNTPSPNPEQKENNFPMPKQPPTKIVLELPRMLPSPGFNENAAFSKDHQWY